MPSNNKSNIKTAAEKAHSAVDKVADVAEAFDEKARNASKNVKSQANDSLEEAIALREKTKNTITDYAKENPLKTAGFAFGAGLIASALLRKS